MVGLFSSHSGSKIASSCHEEGRVFLATAEGRDWLVTHRRNVLLKLLKVKSLPEATQSPCDQAHPLVFVVGREIYESPDLLLQRVPLTFPHEECAPARPLDEPGARAERTVHIETRGPPLLY